MRPEVVLVNPPLRTREPAEHLGLGYLAAVLRRAGVAIEIVDAVLSPTSIRRVVKIVEEAAPRVVGVSAMQPQGRALVAIAQGVKRRLPGAHITAGGHFATFCHDRLLRDVPALDSVVRGEGDLVFVDLAQRVLSGEEWRELPGVSFRQEGTVVSNPAGPLVENLDDLPFPARDIARIAIERTGFLHLLTSRGCYARCTFCSIRAFYDLQDGPPWRARSPENVVEEMARLAREYGCADFGFSDDTFIGPGAKGRERAHAIADAILRRGLRCQFAIMCRSDEVERDLFRHLAEAGLRYVSLGLESGNQRQLHRYRKGATVEDGRRAISVLRDLGIKCRCFLIMFDPDCTIGDCFETLRFVAEARTMRASVEFQGLAAIAIPYDGTELHEQLRREGRLRGSYLKGYSYSWRDPLVGVCAKAVVPIARVLAAVPNPFARSPRAR